MIPNISGNTKSSSSLMDVMTAYLYGLLDSDAYMKVPDGIPILNEHIRCNIVVVLYRGYCGSLVTAHKSRYDWFPLVANGWGTMQPIPDIAPPLLAEGEQPLT
jgi:hypothetical protein